MKEEKRKVYYLFSPFLRIFHWIMVLSIVTLFITGLLITKPVTVMGIEPTYTSMSMDWVVALHYMLLKPGHDPYLRNPLARTSYVGLYVMVLIEILTGFAMYYMTEPNNIGGMLFGWVNVVLGGEMVTHWVHHIVAWLIIVFAIGHVYMVLRADLMEAEGEASSMFSGVKFLEHVPLDAPEINEEGPKSKKKD